MNFSVFKVIVLRIAPMRFNLFMNGFRKFGSASIIYKKSLK